MTFRATGAWVNRNAGGCAADDDCNPPAGDPQRIEPSASRLSKVVGDGDYTGGQGWLDGRYDAARWARGRKQVAKMAAEARWGKGKKT